LSFFGENQPAAMPTPRKSRRRGQKTPYFKNLEEWRAVMIPLIQANDWPGDPVTQDRIAPYLQEYLPRRSAKQTMRTTDAVKKFMYRMGIRFRYTWIDLVREARLK
jgi:hypothetical protein